MKQKFIIANWKSNKTSLEANNWLQEVSSIKYQVSSNSNKKVILYPAFTLLSELKLQITNYKLSIVLGAQDISPFAEGQYTGEVNGSQIREYATYVLVGHSERRTHFGETDEICVQKFEMAQKYGLTTIFCVQDENTPVPSGVAIVAYEPPAAIGSGHPDTPENAQAIASSLKRKTGVAHVLYGGSVKSENVSSFTAMPDISGVLVGGASLDAKSFSSIINNA